MPARRDLPLEEKLKLSVSDMPLSEDTKGNLLRQGVNVLDDLVIKFHKDPGRRDIPFLSCKTFAESGYLVVRMGFDALGSNYVSNGVRVQAADYLDNGIKKAIDSYVNEIVPYFGKRFL